MASDPQDLHRPLFDALIGESNVLAPLLEALWWLPRLLPLWLVNLAHGLYVCHSIRPLFVGSAGGGGGAGAHWLASLVLSVGACVVGATVRYMLLGLRVEWLASDTAIPVYVLTWLIVNYAPGGQPLLRLLPVTVPFAMDMGHWDIDVWLWPMNGATFHVHL